MNAWALTNWGKVLTGLLILLTVAYIGFLQLNIKLLTLNNESLKLELRTKDAEIADWKKLYQIIGDKLAEQNESILDLKQKTEAAKKARISADKRADEISAQARKQENALQAVPASSGPDCEAELSTIRQLLNTRK